MRHFLEIVRRQHVVLGRDEGLEIEPGAARDGAQLGLVRLARRCSRSSVSAERLISQAKAGEPAQNSAKKKATNGAGRVGGERNGEADQRR